MNAFRRIDRVALLEEAVRRQMAERDRRASEDKASRVRYMQALRQQYAVRTPTLRSAVERAEEPYQALRASSEWTRTLAALSIGKSTRITTVDVPVEAGLRGWALSFGATVVLTKRVHYIAPEATILKVDGSLLPVITWWEAGASIPQASGSPAISLSDRMAGYRTVLNLCQLLRTGRLLRVVQSSYLRRIGSSPLRRIFRLIVSHKV
jgi:hypothetical protein